MNADKIVRALRDAEGNNELDCEISELRPLLLKAAALVESLQAQHERDALNYRQKCRDVAELEAQLAREIRSANAWILTASDYRKENERIQTELAASQRRADAAVEDMKVGWLCRACIKRVKGKEWCNCHAVNFVNGPEKTTTCDNFEWRGPQAGEVNQDG